MRFLVMLVLVLAGQAAVSAARAETGEWIRPENTSRELTCVCVVPGNKGALFAGTRDGEVGVSFDRGKSWEFVRCARGYGRPVRAICHDRVSSWLYAGLDTGIFRSRDNGKSWQQVLKASEGNECLALAATPSGIFCATARELIASVDGRAWNAQAKGFQAAALAYSSRDSRLYALSSAGIHSLDLPSGKWEKVTATKSRGADASGAEAAAAENDDISEDDKEDADPKKGGRALAAGENRELFVASAGSIAGSVDSGASWSDIPLPGGSAAQVSGLACGAGFLFAATGKGLFTRGLSNGASPVRAGPDPRFFPHDEPDIAAVRSAAIAYADACPEKILLWRRQAARKAWLPHLTVGLDRETGDLWHWESGSTTKADDDCLRKGKSSLNWSVSFIWELSDLVWNAGQSSIDARSRLNAELRAEVIDEVTRLYFERARLRMEIDRLPLEEGPKRAEKALKLEEDTALLDGLTGGVFVSSRTSGGAEITCK